VGIGQSEVEVAGQVDTTVLVTVPGLGDDVQVLKAGVMEVADIFAVNKADRDGVERCVIEIEQLLGVREMDESTFLPPIVKTVARDGSGIAELADAIDRHREHLERTGLLEQRRRQRARDEVHALIINRLDQWAHARLTDDIEARENLEEVYQRTVDPRTVAEGILRELQIENRTAAC
jgi:LAO/AO transport system kinase